MKNNLASDPILFIFRFIPHVCLPNIGIQTDVFQQPLPPKKTPQHHVTPSGHLIAHPTPVTVTHQGATINAVVSTPMTEAAHNPPHEHNEHTRVMESNDARAEQVSCWFVSNTKGVITNLGGAWCSV